MAADRDRAASPHDPSETTEPSTDAPDLPGKVTLEQPFVMLRTEIDRLFEDFVRDFATPFRWRGTGYNPFGRLEMEFAGTDEVIPRADVVETDAAFVVTVELPGVEQEDIEVSLADGLLTVEGEKMGYDEADAHRTHVSERRYGPFLRSFRVPQTVDQDALSATHDNGVLTIVMPKADAPAPAAAKRVDVTSA